MIVDELRIGELPRETGFRLDDVDIVENCSSILRRSMVLTDVVVFRKLLGRRGIFGGLDRLLS